MRESIAAVRADANSLRDELNLTPILMKALGAAHADNRQMLSSLTARARRQAYVNGIVSIYGLLEESVDRLLLETARTYEAVFPRHADLPDRIKAAHKELTLRALLDPDRARLRIRLDEAAAVNVLVSNQMGSTPRLNAAVFTSASANYRPDYVRSLCNRLDLDPGNEVLGGAALEALRNTGLDYSKVDSLLNNLIERRNDVTHSYQTPELLDSGELLGYLEVVLGYLESLHHVAAAKLLRDLSEQQLKAIGTIVHVYSNALAVDMVGGELEAPCKMLVVRGSSVAVVDVVNLQVDNVDQHGRLRYEGEVVQLGLKLTGTNSGLSVGADIFVLPERWYSLDLLIRTAGPSSTSAN